MQFFTFFAKDTEATIIASYNRLELHFLGGKDGYECEIFRGSILR